MRDSKSWPSHSMAATRPRSSRMLGRNSEEMRRTHRMVSLTSSPRAAMRAAVSLLAGAICLSRKARSMPMQVSDCPSSSWISREMRTRSCSRTRSRCAARARNCSRERRWSSSIARCSVMSRAKPVVPSTTPLSSSTGDFHVSNQRVSPRSHMGSSIIFCSRVVMITRSSWVYFNARSRGQSAKSSWPTRSLGRLWPAARAKRYTWPAATSR